MEIVEPVKGAREFKAEMRTHDFRDEKPSVIIYFNGKDYGILEQRSSMEAAQRACNVYQKKENARVQKGTETTF